MSTIRNTAKNQTQKINATNYAASNFEINGEEAAEARRTYSVFMYGDKMEDNRVLRLVNHEKISWKRPLQQSQII